MVQDEQGLNSIILKDMVYNLFEFTDNIKSQRDDQIRIQLNNKIFKIYYQNDKVVITAANEETKRMALYEAHCVVSKVSIGKYRVANYLIHPFLIRKN